MNTDLTEGNEVNEGDDPPSPTAVVNHLRQKHYGGQERTTVVRRALRRAAEGKIMTGKIIGERNSMPKNLRV